MTTRAALLALADIILALHVVTILFNIFGLVAVPLGAWRGWRFVRIFWWRALHLAILGVVAIQALLGVPCFLTVWHAQLLRAAGREATDAPFIQGFIERLIFWPLPIWVFAVAYVAVGVYTLALFWLVPPVLPRRRR